MKQIKLTKGRFALVDDTDHEWLNQFKWCATRKDRNTFYALRQSPRVNGKRTAILMHREILGFKKGDGRLTDHRDSEGLNNQRSNLRECNHRENQYNSKLQKGTSRFKGVYWNKNSLKWQAQIKINGKSIHLGCFVNEVDAARAYDKKAVELFGEFAKLNFLSKQGVA